MPSLTPKIQKAPFDVADWEEDAEFGVFPQGARAKDAVFAPIPPPEPVIIPGRRYLFKRSRGRYPDQFWGEIIAYRIGCLLGVTVPPAFVAWNSRTGRCASLIEWFYVDGEEVFIPAGDFLTRLHPDYDRKRGKQHNLKDNVRLMRVFAQKRGLNPNWREWWITALLFDAFIGNTDRHQDNWGFVFEVNSNRIRLSPLFDNGTALGHEMFCNNIASWSRSDIDLYINKGTHHMRWSLDGSPPIKGHLRLFQRALNEWPGAAEFAVRCLDFEAIKLNDAIKDLLTFDVPERLSVERYNFILRLLIRRHELLLSILK